MKDLLKKTEAFAVFMGCEFVNDDIEAYPNGYYINKEIDYPFQLKDMQFHTSWDWLMPVVQKIRGLEILDFPKKQKVMNALMAVEILELHQSCFEFIEWYK